MIADQFHKIINKTFSSSFVVFPEHTNHMSPVIFGGKFMAELDLCAAKCIRRALYSKAGKLAAVTHKMDVNFLMPCYLGDLILMDAEIVSVGKKSLVIDVIAYRETYDGGRDKVAKASFVFITITKSDFSDKPTYLPYVDHGLEL